MITLPGYQILTQIYESLNTLVYRGIRDRDSQPVILKVLKADYPSPEELTRYQQEYKITCSLKGDRVVRAYDLQNYQNTLVILFEDFGGESLKLLMNSQRFTLSQFLNLAIKIVDGLGQIHTANIIHKDINPSNIVFNPTTGQLKLIDFGIATVLPRENPALKNPSILEGTLAYLSPEQTGRINRSLDYRTDFYSLGATFYQLLTHNLPFDSHEAIELVHCHIAKQPKPPHLRPEKSCPKAVSDIVMRLMAKMAEERYQSAYGIKADLQCCLTQLETKGQIFEFPIGSQDSSDKFQIPQKLYGREQDIKTLLEAFERVTSPQDKLVTIGGVEAPFPAKICQPTRPIELMLVTGYSGIGKSALVKEIYQPITRHRGYFIEGKFEQFQRNSPYLGVVNAFSDLVRQLLTEPEVQLRRWKENLLAALGVNGQVIIDVIPEVTLIIGSQPTVVELEPAESQNRFNLVFQNFIRVFCQPEHPLVLFLDDLQWVDSATLKLMELILTDDQMHSLFLIGAYRDNKVGATHPLTMTLQAIGKAGAVVNQITLKPLNLDQITQLIAETLHRDPETVKPLANLVMQKTNGNPFFVNEFLKTLYQDNLITFDRLRRTWQWDMNQIQEKAITDNVVELMIGRLKNLPESTQQVLGLAACVGNQFDVNILSRIQGETLSRTCQALMTAIQAGLIVPTSALERLTDDVNEFSLFIRYYKFLHDRVQQAADALISEQDKQAIHLKIGRLLVEDTPRHQGANLIFELVDHLNRGRDLISDDLEKLELAAWNLEAGKKAKDATAYVAARDYLIAGIACLSETVWDWHYDLGFELYKERSEVEYLNGNFEESEAWIDRTLSQTRSALEQAQLYRMLIIQYTMMAKYQDAIQVGRTALSLLGIDLPTSDWKTAVDRELAEVKNKLGDREIASLSEQPEMTSLEKKAAVQLLLSLDPPTYFFNQNLYALVTVKLVNLSLQYGNAPESAKGFSNYGLLLGSVWGDYQGGYEFGLLARKLSDKFNNPIYKCRTAHFMGTFLNSWVRPIQEAESINNAACQAGLEAGDFQYVGYTLNNQVHNAFNQGTTLKQVLAEADQFLLFSRKTQNQWVTDMILSCQLIVWNLMGLTQDQFSFHTHEISETQYLDNCQIHQTYGGLCTFYSLKSWVLYLYGKPNEAFNWIVNAEKWLSFILGIFTQAEHNFYSSLILAELYFSVSQTDQNDYREKLTNNQKQMKIWAENCPENFYHKYLLIEAEIARISGQIVVALDLYDRAIAAAKAQNFIHHEALANELTAKFWLSQGKEEFAQLYLKKAHYGYQLWGADRKVQDLEENYPRLLTQPAAKIDRNPIRTSLPTTSISGSQLAGTLDLTTVFKASQIFASEIVLDNLLATLVKILIENAGATKGYLILATDSQLRIEAQGTVDNEQVTVFQSIPIEQSQELSAAIINYVARTQDCLVLNDATHEGQFTTDTYILQNQPKSILCLPLIHQGKLSGMLYLENTLTTGAFTSERVELLNLLSSQAAISIENARLWKKQAELNTSLQVEIAERQRTEVELRKSEELYRTLVQNFPNGSVLLFDHNLRYLLAEGQGLGEVGWTREQLQGKTLWDALPPEIYTQLEPLYRSALAGETNSSEIPFLNRIYRVYTLPVQNEEGKIFAGMVMSQDITLQKQAEEVLKNARDVLEDRVQERTKALTQANIALQAEIAERLEVTRKLEQLTAELQRSNQELEQFAYIASHDLQEPLRAVASYTQLLEQNYLDHQDESVREYMAFIVDGATRMRQLIQDLLTYSRVGTSGLEVAPTDCNAVLHQVLDNLQIAIAQSNAIITQNLLPTVNADKTQLVQVFQNLIGNAIKFRQEAPPQIHIAAQLKEGEWLFSVGDNGIGIKPQYLERIFQIFKRLHTRRKFSGTGIGLAICKKIVERHGGRIWAESQPGLGTTFFFTIPLVTNSHDRQPEVQTH